MIEGVSRKAVVAWLGVAAGVFTVVAVTTAGADGSVSRTPPLAGRPNGAAPLPPPPVDPVAAAPGTYPIWPVGPAAAGPAYPTPTDVARDFAVRALGISDPTIHEPANVSADGIETVGIALPTVDRELAVVTQRQVDGNWEIIQVGDQRHLEGITMLPGGKPGPVMTIHPPAAAISGDITEQAADDNHEIHLTAADLRQGLAHLIARENQSVLLGEPIHTVLIIYRDSRNASIDALGDEFG